MKRLICCLALMTHPALAETGGEGAGFGDVAAEPTYHEDMAEGITITASIVLDGTGKLATQVSRLVPLRLQSFITVQKGTGPQHVKLRCKATWKDANNDTANFVKDVPDCLDATLQDDGMPTNLALGFRFTPGKDDPVGTSGFLIEVEDEISGAGTVLQVTYAWKGQMQ